MQAQSFTATLLEHRTLAPHTFVLRMGGCAPLAHTQPGQFVMLRGEWGRDPLLPRAFSLLAVEGEGTVTLLIKNIGRGTALLEHARVGAQFRILGPLGCGFPAPSAERHDLLVAGGVGLAPILMQAELAVQRGLGAHCEIFYGARSAADLVLTHTLERLSGVRCHFATEDGSRGAHGRVTAPLGERLAALVAEGRTPTLQACGPNPMLGAVREVARKHGAPCFVSLEGEMACGYGVCLGCAVATAGQGAAGVRGGAFRYVCKDGPVFDANEVDW